MSEQHFGAEIEGRPAPGHDRREALEFTPRDETVGFLLWDARRALSRQLNRKLNRHGVGSGVFSVLRILWDEDRLTQSEIARRGRMTGPTIVGIETLPSGQEQVTMRVSTWPTPQGWPVGEGAPPVPYHPRTYTTTFNVNP